MGTIFWNLEDERFKLWEKENDGHDVRDERKSKRNETIDGGVITRCIVSE